VWVVVGWVGRWVVVREAVVQERVGFGVFVVVVVGFGFVAVLGGVGVVVGVPVDTIVAVAFESRIVIKLSYFPILLPLEPTSFYVCPLHRPFVSFHYSFP
jgi:hypothetical protein